MIGQTRTLLTIDKMIDEGTLPRFSIICGGRGAGKLLLAKHIAKQLGAQLVVSNIKVDEVRQVIDLSYRQSEPTLYLFPKADKMSIAAKNAMLKITEEPPRKAYFITTLYDINNTLQTLKSRGAVFNIEPYSPSELLTYVKEQRYEITPAESVIISEICTTPGEVDIIIKYDITAFYNYVNTVVDSIGEVNGANAFKIGSKLSYKAEDEGWDITLFMRAIMLICNDRLLRSTNYQDIVAYSKSIKITSNYLSQMSITGINKSSTIDMWILDMREIWRS